MSPLGGSVLRERQPSAVFACMQRAATCTCTPHTVSIAVSVSTCPPTPPPASMKKLWTDSDVRRHTANIIFTNFDLSSTEETSPVHHHHLFFLLSLISESSFTLVCSRVYCFSVRELVLVSLGCLIHWNICHSTFTFHLLLLGWGQAWGCTDLHKSALFIIFLSSRDPRFLFQGFFTGFTSPRVSFQTHLLSPRGKLHTNNGAVWSIQVFRLQRMAVS